MSQRALVLGMRTRIHKEPLTCMPVDFGVKRLWFRVQSQVAAAAYVGKMRPVAGIQVQPDRIISRSRLAIASHLGAAA